MSIFLLFTTEQVESRSDSNVGLMLSLQMPRAFHFVCKIKWSPSFSSMATTSNSPLVMMSHLDTDIMMPIQRHRSGFHIAYLRTNTGYWHGPSSVGMDLQSRASKIASHDATVSKFFQNQGLQRAQSRRDAAQDQKQQLYLCYSFIWIMPFPIFTWTAKLIHFSLLIVRRYQNWKYNNTTTINENSCDLILNSTAITKYFYRTKIFTLYCLCN